MPIGEFCNREVVIADPRTSVAEAAALMRKHHVGNIVVVDRMDGPRKPVGIDAPTGRAACARGRWPG